MRHTLTTVIAASALVCAAPLLTACSGDTVPTASTVQTEEAATQAVAVTLENGWAKSATAGGMTGVFGTLTSSSPEDLIITGVESDAAGMVELHEVTADGVMQKIKGEVVIPAEGTFELAPGANHIMLMNLSRDLLAGDEVTFTLQLKAPNGEVTSSEFTVLVKDYAGANESYNGENGSHEMDQEHAEN